MELLLGIAYAIIGILAVLVLRSLTTLFHELGHALPAIWFTNGPVKVFIGTYGDEDQGFPINLGRLSIRFRVNILDWKNGMCAHQGVDKLWKSLLIILGGPIASLLIAIPLLIYISNTPTTEALRAIILVFVAAASLDFMVNIFPVARRVGLNEGKALYNDGYQIYQLISRMNIPVTHLELEALYENKEYQVLEEKAKQLIEEGEKSYFVFHLLIMSYLESKRYWEALEIYEDYIIGKYRLKFEGNLQLGKIYQELNQHENAIIYFNNAIHENFQDAEALSERGYSKIELRNYQEAIKDLSAAIFYQSDYAEGYAYRALAFIKMNKLKQAFQDLQLAGELKLDKILLDYYWGHYFEKAEQYKEAIDSFELVLKAKPDFPGLAFKIEYLREEL